MVCLSPLLNEPMMVPSAPSAKRLQRAGGLAVLRLGLDRVQARRSPVSADRSTVDAADRERSSGVVSAPSAANVSAPGVAVAVPSVGGQSTSRWRSW